MKKQSQQTRHPIANNVKLKPYQQTEYPFGKPIDFNDDIVVFGEETAIMFRDAEAARVAIDAKRPRKAFVPSNAEALKKTGQLAASPLDERWQKKSDTMHRLTGKYFEDRLTAGKKLSYKEIASVRYILDPEQREDALQKVVDHGQLKKDTKLLRSAIKAGLTYKINFPLDDLTPMMGARDHMIFMQNKMAVANKTHAAKDGAIQKQFIALDKKVTELKSPATRGAMYKAMAAIHPRAKDAAQLAENANAEKRQKTKQKAPSSATPDMTIVFSNLEKLVAADTDATDEILRFQTLTAFEEAEETIAYLADGLTQSKAYERLSTLHPLKADRAFYFDCAVDITANILTPTAKAKRLHALRDSAPDNATRSNVHARFVENASFAQLVTDASELKKTYGGTYDHYVDLMKTSHAAMTQPKKPLTLNEKALYEDRKLQMRRDVNFLWEW